MIDDKPTHNCNDGMIVVDNRIDLRMLSDDKGAFDIAHTIGESERTNQIDVRHLSIQQVHNR